MSNLLPLPVVKQNIGFPFFFFVSLRWSKYFERKYWLLTQVPSSSSMKLEISHFWSKQTFSKKMEENVWLFFVFELDRKSKCFCNTICCTVQATCWLSSSLPCVWERKVRSKLWQSTAIPSPTKLFQRSLWPAQEICSQWTLPQNSVQDSGKQGSTYCQYSVVIFAIQNHCYVPVGDCFQGHETAVSNIL